MIHRFTYAQAKRKGIPTKLYRRQSRLASLTTRLFQLLKQNVTDLQEIDSDIEELTNLVLNEVPHSFLPHMNRTIDSINKDVDCYYLTRFTKQQLKLLYLHLRIPKKFTAYNSHHFDGEFVLILSLTYLASAENMKSLTYKFGGNHDFWGIVFKEFIDHLYCTFYHKISGDSMRNYPKKISRICRFNF